MSALAHATAAFRQARARALHAAQESQRVLAMGSGAVGLNEAIRKVVDTMGSSLPGLTNASQVENHLKADQDAIEEQLARLGAMRTERLREAELIDDGLRAIRALAKFKKPHRAEQFDRILARLRENKTEVAPFIVRVLESLRDEMAGRG